MTRKTSRYLKLNTQIVIVLKNIHQELYIMEIINLLPPKYQLLNTIFYSPSTIHYSLPTSYFQLPNTYYLLFTSFYLPPTTYFCFLTNHTLMTPLHFRFMLVYYLLKLRQNNFESVKLLYGSKIRKRN
jgi:hypothetical protein